MEPALEFLGRGQKEPGGGELCQVGWSVVEAPGDVSVQRMLGVKLGSKVPRIDKRKAEVLLCTKPALPLQYFLWRRQ